MTYKLNAIDAASRTEEIKEGDPETGRFFYSLISKHLQSPPPENGYKNFYPFIS